MAALEPRRSVCNQPRFNTRVSLAAIAIALASVADGSFTRLLLRGLFRWVLYIGVRSGSCGWRGCRGEDSRRELGTKAFKERREKGQGKKGETLHKMAVAQKELLSPYAHALVLKLIFHCLAPNGQWGRTRCSEKRGKFREYSNLRW